MAMESAVAMMWDELAEKAYMRWDTKKYLHTNPKLSLIPQHASIDDNILSGIKTFDGPGPWDRTLVRMKWEAPPADDKAMEGGDEKDVLIFSSNDYLGLSSHPAVREAAAKAALVYGMGPRASALICGNTNYHRQLEDTLAEMTKKEDCVITPTGFAANNAFLSALGSIATLLAVGRRPAQAEKIAIFSDAFNHASIIDGLHLMERHQEAIVYVYKHSDMNHLESLLSSCPLERKVVITDSLFSMEGDFAPMVELVKLRRKYGFLFVIDEAHTTLVCGKSGEGIGAVFGIENEIDICIGTLSKAIGSIGGFISCSKKWKQLIQSRGRPYIFSTALPLPVVAGVLVAIEVSKKEEWRRKAVWNHVQYFSELTGFHPTSPIVSIVTGTEESAFRVSKQLLELGFHATAIRPPAVPADACRLRITLSAAHSREDIKKLVMALSQCMKLPAYQGEIEHIVSSL